MKKASARASELLQAESQEEGEPAKVVNIDQAKGKGLIVSMNQKQKDNTAGYLYDLSKGVALLTVSKPL
jgi:hypothetical protein